MKVDKSWLAFVMFVVAAMFFLKVLLIVSTADSGVSLEGLEAIRPLYPVIIEQLLIAAIYSTFGVLVLRYSGTTHQRLVLSVGPGLVSVPFVLGLAQAWAAKSSGRVDPILDNIMVTRSITSGLALFIAVVAFLFVRQRSAGAP